MDGWNGNLGRYLGDDDDDEIKMAPRTQQGRWGKEKTIRKEGKGKYDEQVWSGSLGGEGPLFVRREQRPTGTGNGK